MSEKKNNPYNKMYIITGIIIAVYFILFAVSTQTTKIVPSSRSEILSEIKTEVSIKLMKVNKEEIPKTGDIEEAVLLSERNGKMKAYVNVLTLIKELENK